MLVAISDEVRSRSFGSVCCTDGVSGERRAMYMGNSPRVQAYREVRASRPVREGGESVLGLPGDVLLPQLRPVGVPPQPASGTGAEEEGEAVGARQCAVPFRCAQFDVRPQPKTPQAWQVCLPLC